MAFSSDWQLQADNKTHRGRPQIMRRPHETSARQGRNRKDVRQATQRLVQKMEQYHRKR